MVLSTLPAYSERVEFIETPGFTRLVRDYLTDEEYRALQNILAENPELGDRMPETGGFRKVRWTDRRRGKGRRGGLRIIYYHFPADHQIWLMTLYDKNEADDLTPGGKKALRAAISAEVRARDSARQKKRY